MATDTPPGYRPTGPCPCDGAARYDPRPTPVSHPRWVAMKVAVDDKPWAVGELTGAPDALDYHEVASYRTLEEANSDIATRKRLTKNDRIAGWRRDQRAATRRKRARK